MGRDGHLRGQSEGDRAIPAEAIYIIGDLYEYSIGDDDPGPALRPTIEALARLGEHGVATYFVHGNRDFLIDRGFERQTGCKLLSEATVIDLYGIATLIMHGDILCIDDKLYQAFRAKIRNPIMRRLLLSLSRNLRHRIARSLRDQSQREIADKTVEIMDVNQQAVETVMRHYAVHRLIHGHTHRPGIYELTLDGVPAKRIVLGDWYEQGSLLRCTPQDCELITVA